jgi:glyceraldehyde-3-phosphate dehydrogenase (NADP+)
MNAPIITQSHTVESIFPTADQIPEAFRIKTPLNQREYLINGELRHWDGEVEEVISPIHIQTDQGLVAAKIGHFPLLLEFRLKNQTVKSSLIIRTHKKKT